jgi:2-haloacid dehalogenase
MMKTIDAVIFDLGGVLIDWNPRYVFHENYFEKPEQLEFFLDKVCTPEWNETQDAGYPIARATEEKVAEFPNGKTRSGIITVAGQPC